MIGGYPRINFSRRVTRIARESNADHTVPYGTDSPMSRFQAFRAWLPS